MGPEEMLLAPLPLEWSELIQEGSHKYDKPMLIPETIPIGQRNDTLFRLACSLQTKGLSEQSILAAISQENQEKCSPPLDELEINRICKSVSSYKHTNINNNINSISYRPGDFSDAGNAEVFSRVYKEKLIYIDALGWLYWNGQKWERNNHCAIGMAIELSTNMLNEAKSSYRKAQIDSITDENNVGIPDNISTSLKVDNIYINHVHQFYHLLCSMLL